MGESMEPEFWHERWKTNQIGFHEPEGNEWLPRFWPALKVPAGSRVWVPLCGKSVDMLWLLKQGYAVRGIELNNQAIEQFFAENQLEPTIIEHGSFTVYSCGDLEIWLGSVFDIRPEHLADCQGWYDRAALIALPADLRANYMAQITRCLPEGCRGLLITLEYMQSERQGPPFAVQEQEVHAGFDAFWQVELLARQDVLALEAKFARQGVTSLHEAVYALERKSRC